MKVRNIMFFGFAAAILMGTANAAGTFQIASKAYVDSRVSSASSAASEVADAVGDMDDLGDTENSNIASGTDNLVDAVNDLDAALNTKQNEADSRVAANGNHITAGHDVKGNLVALDTALGTVESAVGSYNSQTGEGSGLMGDVADLQDAIGDLPQNSNIADLLDGKQDALGGGNDAGKVVTATSTAGTVDYTAIDTTVGTGSNLITSGAVKTYVDNAIQNVTGGGATIGVLDDGNGGTYNSVADALAAKQDRSASTISAAQESAGNHLTEGNGVAGNLVALDSAIGALETAVGDSSAGLVHDVAALQDAIDGANGADGLADRVDDLETAVGDSSSGLVQLENLIRGYSDCITQAEALREPGDNSAAHCVLSASTSGGIEWTPVTFPWVAD